MHTFPYGEYKRRPLNECPDAELQRGAAWLSKKLDDPEYGDGNRELMEAMEAELSARKSGKREPGSKPRQTPVPRNGNGRPRTATRPTDDGELPLEDTRLAPRNTSLAGTYEGVAANEALRRAAEVGHLITPQQSCPALPEGFGVSLSYVWIDVERDTYDAEGGKRGISKAPLLQIAAAAGADWIPELTGRVDDGSDPHYCHYQTWMIVEGFDGSKRRLPGSEIQDLRDRGPVANTVTEKELRKRRAKMIGHAETKAMLRAVRALGLHTAYPIQELQKPFIVARLMITSAELMAQRMQQNYQASATALYGAPASPQLQRHTPPPLEAEGAEVDDDPEEY